MGKRWASTRAGTLTAVLPVFVLSVALLQTFGCTPKTPSSGNPSEANPTKAATPSATGGGGAHPTKAAPSPPETAAPPQQPRQHVRVVEHSAAVAPASAASDDEIGRAHV